MLLAGVIIVCVSVLLIIAWYEDFCPQCRRHAVASADVGPRCERCGWFER